MLLLLPGAQIPVQLPNVNLYINLACLSIWCLGVCLCVSNKRQNG